MQRLVSLMAVVAILASACMSSSAPAQGPQTLTVGLGGEFASMNPNYNYVVVTASVYEAMFEHLVRTDPFSGKATPELATAWKQVSPLVWEFTIREGVKFHNGDTMTADDVASTFNRIIAEKQVSSIKNRILSFDKAEIVDAKTVRITTKTPEVLLLGLVGEVWVYPKKYYETLGNDGFSEKPVGTGQYKFVEWQKGGAITLEANRDYWGDKPKIDKLVARPYPDTTTRLAALEAGEIDIAYNIYPDDAKRLEAQGKVAASVPNGQGTGINLLWLPPRATNPLAKKLVRQALNYAVDKDTIVKNILLGYSKKLDGQVLGPDAFGFNPSVQAYPYDPEKAKALLREAGYPNGFTIEFESAAANYAKAKEVSENVVDQLAKVGVTAKLTMLEWNVYIDRALRNVNSAPMTYVGWNYYPVMDADFAIRHFITSSPYKLHSNPKMDELYLASKAEADRSKREKILQEFNALMREEAPMLFLFQSPLIYGVNPRVKGFKPTPDDRIHFVGISVGAK